MILFILQNHLYVIIEKDFNGEEKIDFEIYCANNRIIQYFRIQYLEIDHIVKAGIIIVLIK